MIEHITLTHYRLAFEQLRQAEARRVATGLTIFKDSAKLSRRISVATKHETKSQLLHSVSNHNFSRGEFASLFGLPVQRNPSSSRARVLCPFADDESG
jgi:hypothetical protein